MARRRSERKGRDLPRAERIQAPDFYLYGTGKIPVRFLATADGGMNVQWLNPRTRRFARANWLISEIFFKPFTSTEIERVSEEVFDKRVAELRGSGES